jgi:quercetin dioxygenase-like cupin family protein
MATRDLASEEDSVMSRSRAFIPVVLCLAVAATSHAADSPATAPAATVKPVLTQALPDLRGKEVLMLTVEYPPGGASPAHRHNANTFVYVLEGAVVMQVAGGKEVTVKAGETFYESPSDVHSVSRNASASERAKFLVFFVKDAGAPTTAPVQ